jgi:glucose uptake protein GlcU
MKAYGNMGRHERVIRMGIGLLLLGLAGFSLLPGWGDVVLMIMGFIALVTGIIGFCPAWRALGINTCSQKKAGTPFPPLQPSEHEHADTSPHQS